MYVFTANKVIFLTHRVLDLNMGIVLIKGGVSMEDFDKKLQQAIEKQAKLETSSLTDEISEEIERAQRQQIQRRKRSSHKTVWFIAIAIIVIVICSTLTKPGMALIQSIQEKFSPRKGIEGQKEKDTLQINEDFVIHMDEVR